MNEILIFPAKHKTRSCTLWVTSSQNPVTHVSDFLLVVLQLLSCVWLFVTPWTAACPSSLSITVSWTLLRLMSIELMMPFNHLILCCRLLLLLSIFPSIKVSSNELALLNSRPKYWSFSFSISPYNEYAGLISFDWFDILAVQGTLKSLLQNHSLKASVLQHSDFFTVQLSHLYVTIGKNIALTIWIFVRKVTSLLFNMLSRFVITFLWRNKDFLHRAF